MRIALAGNPNSGKTTMYNALTGKNEKVGNWAGVTVEKKEHPIKKAYFDGEQQLIAVKHGANAAALADLLTEAAEAGKSELVVQFSSSDTQAQQVRRIVEQVQAARGSWGWTVNFYPSTESIGVVEILMG